MYSNLVLASGWGIVHDESGTHWVYIPLWDPIKSTVIGKSLITALVIKQHLASIDNLEAKEILNGVVKQETSTLAKSFANADIDDDWCPTYPHHFHFPHTGGTPGFDPDNPVYRKALGENLYDQINSKVAITALGNLMKNKDILRAAEML